jgi:SAM-dependent methyltransferase
MQKLRLRAFVRERVLRHSPQKIFSRIYEKNSWANSESLSGDGSDLVQTGAVRRELARLIEEFGIKSILDAPCGDYNWMQHVEIDGAEYIGADIVPALIAENGRKYGGARRHFSMLDICRDKLPRVDLIVCRDCLVHLSLQSALAAVRNFALSGSTYLLATTYPTLVRRNKELYITGSWRPLDLQRPPFSLPEPIRLINEECTEPDDFKEKSLGLWDLTRISPP